MSRWQLARPALISALEAAAADGAERLDQLPQVSADSGLDRPTAEAFSIHEVSRGLVAALSTLEPFVGGTGFLVAKPRGYRGFHADEASGVLVRRVIAGHSAEEALRWLSQILDTSEAPGKAIMAIRGVECELPIELSQGVQLLPIDMLPDTKTRAQIVGPQDPASAMLGQDWRPPSAALVVSDTLSPLLYPASGGEPPQQEDPFRLTNLLDDARLALTLIGPSHPLPGGHWFEFDDPELRLVFGAGGVFFEHLEVIPWGHIPPQRVEAEPATRLVSAFLGMKEEGRTQLRLALRRFNQAMRRPAHGDRALDLAIALETLLVDGSGENTYKISLHAALLLGGSLEDRYATRAVVSALYALRSRLVHDGILPKTVGVKGTGKRPAADVVKDATSVATRIFSAILDLGRVPDWYAIELGQPTSSATNA